MNPKSMISYIIIFIVLILSVGVWVGCTHKKTKKLPPVSQVHHPAWAKNAVIYEVNIRQYSKEGTFKAFEKDLPRLKQLGVDILWIMPVNPIGVLDRKGKLGSYYSVKDYMAINPEFGTMDDFKAMVQKAHSMGMKVILDWVANHTSKDNELFIKHPEYYLKDSLGKFVSPFDWTDVVRLDFSNPDTRKYMINTMKWWVVNTNIDGFRCDVAHMVPTSFWDELRPTLEKVKPVFMLAESDMPSQQIKAFDMTYDWKLYHIMNDIAKGKKNANAVQRHFNMVDTVFPGNAYLMEFTSNHDENTWSGSEYERLGNGAKTFAVLSATVDGMMLIYNGQEAAFKRRLNFFDKDSIDWDHYSLTGFYQKLIALKHRNKALWNGDAGGHFQRVTSNRDSSVFAFVRAKDGQKVFVICNLTPKQINVTFKSDLMKGRYNEIFTNEEQRFGKKYKTTLSPWQYFVYEELPN